MTRLLQVMAGARNGGAELFFSRLAIALSEIEYSQKVVIRKNKERFQQLKEGDVDVTEMRFGGPLDFLTSYKLRKLAADYQPEVVLTWMTRATQKLPKGAFKHVARLGGYYNLQKYRKCDYLIGNTQTIINYMTQHGWPSDKIIYIPNFVDERKGSPLERSMFDTPTGFPIILALGRFHKNKGFDVLLEALASIPDVFLWLAGDGAQKQTLVRIADNLKISNRVRFLGWRSDTANLLAAADALICPSRHEPLGNVILEAWAQGKPVIAASSDGPKELITSGKNGFLCEIDNPTNLADKVKMLLADANLAEELASEGRQTYERNFSKKIIVKQYTDFFDKLVK
tara:strand:- start:3274 stop:4299 length:1026 start_codon:yes stop_codon:yes gene_type:complete